MMHNDLHSVQDWQRACEESACASMLRRYYRPVRRWPRRFAYGLVTLLMVAAFVLQLRP